MNDWTIYNNESKWRFLSDEQKGALLLAFHESNGNTMLRVNKIGDSKEVNMVHWISCSVYRAIKPEPEMWELLQNDLLAAGFPRVALSESLMKTIAAKGWTKNDK
jgi:hypothetical protein